MPVPAPETTATRALMIPPFCTSQYTLGALYAR